MEDEGTQFMRNSGGRKGSTSKGWKKGNVGDSLEFNQANRGSLHV